ncbi:hypothetical protein GCM10009715_00950 [Paeniglutamicibacter psychrophenolicus]|uniref:Uncharacterized protein n=1 Tax=Paeniglutamicibacter psychrophenolicus TaxID=257454 RepID=A0ABS4WBJ4_9MICC|nr:hypothetical protein [Paeniglutamicibacter psychrophenolicus]MBP2373580.1 hypothetical protein [Paeniglutamicibacter psychrophenolicus]
MEKATSWTRFLGVSLRPFSGHAPLSLILRGALQAAICIVLLVVGARMRAEIRHLAAVDAGASRLGGVLVLAGVVLVVLALAALVKIAVGILDLVPRTSVPGTVVSISERKFLDFLPDAVNNALWDRKNTVGQSWAERRRVRHELVIDTGHGTRAWTLRNRQKARGLRPGQAVTVVASPLVGYVDRLESGI